MKSQRIRTIAILTALVSALGSSAMSAQEDKYTLKVPGGLAFSEFRGYENWQVVSISQDGGLLAVILANPVMIKAYRAGVPGNGKPVPDGAKIEGERLHLHRVRESLNDAELRHAMRWNDGRALLDLPGGRPKRGDRAVGVAREVELDAPSAAGAAQGVVCRFVSRPLFRAPAAARSAW